MEDVLADNNEGIASVLEYQDETDRIKTALSRLPEREMQVISFYYYEGLTLKEIGQILGVTESRVSQIHSKAIATLRNMLKESNTVNDSTFTARDLTLKRCYY